MLTLTAFALMLAQDRERPPRPEGGPDRMDRPPMEGQDPDLMRRMDELRARLERAEGEERERIEAELRDLEMQTRRGPGRGHDEPLTDESRAELLAWLEEVAPEQARELQRIRDEGREDEYELRLRGMAGWMRGMRRMEEHDPERYHEQLRTMRLEHRSMELGRQHQETEDEAERASIDEELNGVLSELFDLREAQREREVRELEQRLVDLRAQLEDRRAHKDEIVELRAAQLTGRDRAFDWR